MDRLSRIIANLETAFTNNRILPVSFQWIEAFETQYGPIPTHLKELYLTLGYGSFGDGHFQIQYLLEPDEVYFESTANTLAGTFIVITGSAGETYAYNINADWCFGEIDLHGKFIPMQDLYKDLYDYLESIIEAELET